MTFDIFRTKIERISAARVSVGLKEHVEANQRREDDVPRQWYLRGTGGDGDSPHRNEERSSMVFTFSPG